MEAILKSIFSIYISTLRLNRNFSMTCKHIFKKHLIPSMLATTSRLGITNLENEEQIFKEIIVFIYVELTNMKAVI